MSATKKVCTKTKVLETVGNAIFQATEHLSDAEYLEVLETLMEDIEAKIEAKKQEMGV